MSSEYFQLHEWESEKCQRLIESEKRRYHQMEIDKLKAEKEEAIKQGIEQGIEQEIEQGIAQGEVKGKKEIVKNMLENGFDDETISKISNLSIKEIIKIKESL